MKNKSIKDLLAKYPKLNMSILPTPVHRLNNLSEKFGLNIYCKRDDMTGFAFGGNKTRKLDYLIAEALSLKKDTIVAIGANQSNFCRMAAAAGVLNGLEVHLVLSGEKTGTPTGNLLVDHLLEVNIHHILTEDDDQVAAAAGSLEKELIKKGKNVYNMPLGGSVPTGIFGYVEAFGEILGFCEQNDIKFNKMFHATGSGGTQAGLVVGQAVSGWEGEIIGFSVGKAGGLLSVIIIELANQTSNIFDIQFDPELVRIDESYVGEKYGAKTEKGSEAIKIFAQNEGIMLDNVYTGKAAAGLLDYIKKDYLNKDDNILFIHTGGNIELFE